MASDRPAFCRPVEFVSESPDMVWTFGGVPHNISVDSGVYANVFVLAQNIVKQLTSLGHGADMAVTFVESPTQAGQTIFHFGGGAPLTITWAANHLLRDALGFTNDYTDETSIYAELPPRYYWIPTYVRADQNQWKYRYDTVYVGNEGLTGRVAGIASGSDVFELSVSFPHELAANVYGASCASINEIVRSLEYFYQSSRTSWPQTDTYPPVGGFQFWADWTDIATILSMTSMSGVASGNHGGGNGSCLPAAALDWVYCNFDTKGGLTAKTSLPRGITRHNVELSFHTAELMAAYNATSVVT